MLRRMSRSSTRENNTSMILVRLLGNSTGSRPRLMSKKGKHSSKSEKQSSKSNLKKLLTSRYRMDTRRMMYMSTSTRSLTANAWSSGNKRALKPETGLKQRSSFLMRIGNPRFCPMTSIELWWRTRKRLIWQRWLSRVTKLIRRSKTRISS